jgi:outer membrane murein-binding lipoprotein Lpp
MKYITSLFLSLFVLSGCVSTAKENIHADEWIKVNKYTGD